MTADIRFAVPEAEKSRIQAPADAVSPGSCVATVCLGPHVVQEAEGALRGLLYADSNPIREGSTLLTHPEAPPPAAIARKLGFLPTSFGGAETFRPSHLVT